MDWVGLGWVGMGWARSVVVRLEKFIKKFDSLPARSTFNLPPSRDHFRQISAPLPCFEKLRSLIGSSVSTGFDAGAAHRCGRQCTYHDTDGAYRDTDDTYRDTDDADDPRESVSELVELTLERSLLGVLLRLLRRGEKNERIREHGQKEKEVRKRREARSRFLKGNRWIFSASVSHPPFIRFLDPAATRSFYGPQY